MLLGQTQLFFLEFFKPFKAFCLGDFPSPDQLVLFFYILYTSLRTLGSNPKDCLIVANQMPMRIQYININHHLGFEPRVLTGR